MRRISLLRAGEVTKNGRIYTLEVLTGVALVLQGKELAVKSCDEATLPTGEFAKTVGTAKNFQINGGELSCEILLEEAFEGMIGSIVGMGFFEEDNKTIKSFELESLFLATEENSNSKWLD